MTLLESKLKCEDQEYLKRKQELTFSLKELIDSNEKEPEVKKVLSKNKIDSLFRNLPIDEEKFLTELDNIKKELSKEITIDNSLISQETSELLKKIKTELDSVREKTNEYQKFEEEKIKKEQELSKFKDFIYANKELDTVDLSQIIELLKKQELLTKNKNEESAKELEISKRKTKRLNKISDEEINQLCQLQSEITQIELQLNKKLEQSTKQLTKVVNNITNNYGTIFKNSNLEINGGQNLLGGDNKIISQKRTKRDS
jgi:hypothetical protein